MDRHWPLLSFFGSVVGFYLLLIRNPDIKIGAQEQTWFVIAVWYAALNFMPFMLICNSLLGNQIKNMCKDSWFLNAFLSFIFLVIPAVIDHLAQYPEFHINVKDVKQHNSEKRYELFAACSFAISSWGLSKTYDLTFESGLFSICLEYAMKCSLTIVNKTGKKRDIFFILGTFGFCLVVILWRKYLERKESRDTARQRDSQSSDNNNTADQRPNDRTDGAYLNPFAASHTNYLWGRFRTLMYRVAQNETNQPRGIITRCGNRTLGGVNVQDGNIQRDIREDSLDINEQNGENFPPNDASSNSTDTEDEEVPPIPIVSDVCVGKREETEVASLEIEHEERDTRSSTSSGYVEITDSSELRGYVKDDVPLLPPKSDNMIDRSQTERSKDPSQEGSHGYEIDDNPLVPKNTPKVDKDDKDDDDNGSDHESSDGKGSDGDDSQIGKGCMLLGVRQKHKDTCQESDYQKLEDVKDDILLFRTKSNNITYGETQTVKGQMKRSKDQSQDDDEDDDDDSPLLLKRSLRVHKDYDDHDLDHESSNGEESDGDDFHRRTGCKLRICHRHKDPGQESGYQELEDMRHPRDDISEIYSDSNLRGDIPLLSESKNMDVDLGQMEGSVDSRDEISDEGTRKTFSDDGASNTSSDDRRLAKDDFNSRAGCEVGVGWTGRNKCLVKRKYIPYLDNSRFECIIIARENCFGIPSTQSLKLINIFPNLPSPPLILNSWAGWKADVGQRGSSKHMVKEGEYNTTLDKSQLTSSSNVSDSVESLQDGESGFRSENALMAANTNQIEAEWIEQYEPGVYITLVNCEDGTRDIKRVRFSRKIFQEHQAETWWSENRLKVYEMYDIRSTNKSSGQAAGRAEGAASPVSRALIAANTNQLETEWIEQYEPGVYVTIVNFKDGTRDLKRVRFSRRRFQEHQAETWWSENREKVYKKFDVHITYTASEQAAERGRGRCFTCFPSSREIDSE